MRQCKNAGAVSVSGNRSSKFAAARPIKIASGGGNR
jgi:hypothetical protein